MFLWKTNFDAYFSEPNKRESTCRVNGQHDNEEGMRHSGSLRRSKKPSVVVVPSSQVERKDNSLDRASPQANRGDHPAVREDANVAASASVECHHQPQRITGVSAPSYVPLSSTINLPRTVS